MTPEQRDALDAKFADHRRTLVVHPSQAQGIAEFMATRPFGCLTPKVVASDLVDAGHSMLLPSKASLRDRFSVADFTPREQPRVRLPIVTEPFLLNALRFAGVN